MAGTYSRIYTKSPGDTISSSERNDEHQNHINNADPDGIGDASADNTEFQATKLPSTASKPTNLRQEVQALRYQILKHSALLDPSITTWDEVPTFKGVIQTVHSEDGAVATGSTLMVYDDTIPQNTEGDQYLSASITPTSATNKLLIEAQVVMAHSALSAVFIAALFQDSTADALSSVLFDGPGVNLPIILAIKHEMTAGTTSSTTFKVRAGSDVAGGTTFNGKASARLLGGVMNSYLRITEYNI
jgi:hypothetical protein